MGHRREPRIELHSQASLCGMDPLQARSFLEPVTIRNISGRGLLVEARRCFVRPSDVVVLRHKQHKGRFEVIWAGETPDGARKQLGLRHLLSTTLFWGIELPLPAPDDYQRPRLQARRRHPRYSCEVAVEVRLENSRTPIWSTTSDISEAGCFVHLLNVLPLLARLDIALWVREAKVWAQGIVVSSLIGSGTGIKFVAISEEGSQRISELIACLPRVADRRVTLDESLAWDIEADTYSEQKSGLMLLI
jgi:hypothetical protein